MAKSAQIKEVSAKHENILNYIIMNPLLRLAEVAAYFGVTQPWLSTIIHSDAFQDRLKQRQDEFFDSAVLKGTAEKLAAAADMTIDAYMEKVSVLTADQLISGADKLLGKLGYGSGRAGASVHINGNANVQINNGHVPKGVLTEARSRIGTGIKVGAPHQLAALLHTTTEERFEAEGVAI